MAGQIDGGTLPWYAYRLAWFFARSSRQVALPGTDILLRREGGSRLFGRQRTDLRRHNRLIGDLDLLMAATCLHHHLTLLTTNPRHFQRIPELTVVSRPGS